MQIPATPPKYTMMLACNSQDLAQNSVCRCEHLPSALHHSISSP